MYRYHCVFPPIYDTSQLFCYRLTTLLKVHRRIYDNVHVVSTYQWTLSDPRETIWFSGLIIHGFIHTMAIHCYAGVEVSVRWVIDHSWFPKWGQSYCLIIKASVVVTVAVSYPGWDVAWPDHGGHCFRVTLIFARHRMDPLCSYVVGESCSDKKRSDVPICQGLLVNTYRFWNNWLSTIFIGGGRGVTFLAFTNSDTLISMACELFNTR